MNFKLVFLFTAVLCFGQGHAWFGEIFKKAEDFGTDMANKVKGGLNDVQDSIANKVKSGLNDIQDAGSKLKDHVDAARKNAEDALTDKLNQARDEIQGAANNLKGEINSLTEKTMASMSPSNIFYEASEIINKMDVVVADAKLQVEGAIKSATSGAESRINAWDVVVKQAAAKASELGVDIKDCSVDRVQELGKSALKNAVGCLTNKIDEGKTLVKKFISMGTEGHDIVNDIKTAYESCSQKETVESVKCGAMEMLPMLKRIIALSTDAIGTSSQAVTLVQTLQVSLSTCMTTVAATETSKVPELTIDITKCIGAKIQEKSAAAA